jgi:ferredoxin
MPADWVTSNLGAYFYKTLRSLVIFELDGHEVEAARGDRLLDLLDDLPSHGLPIACRGGNCGTCRVRVIEGEYALVPPTAAEQKLLELCGAQRSERLGCQIRVRADLGAAQPGSKADSLSVRVKMERA